LVEVEIRTGSGNAADLRRISLDMTSHGARPTWASRADAGNAGGRVGQPEANGGRTRAPAQDVGTIGRIATVDDPLGAELAKAGSR
jgi:uncharacterized protein